MSKYCCYIKRLMLWLVMPVTLLFCLQGCIKPLYINWPEPEKNPNPQYFVTIHGYIDPRLEGKVRVQFAQKTVGWSDICARTTNYWAGATGAPTKIDLYKAQPNAEGYYTLEIPIDGYLSGKCEFEPYTLSRAYMYYSKKSGEPNYKRPLYLSLFAYKENPITNRNPKIFNLYCGDTTKSCQYDLIPDGSTITGRLGFAESYNLEFNAYYNPDLKEKKRW